MQMQNVLTEGGRFIMFYLCSYNHMLIMFLLLCITSIYLLFRYDCKRIRIRVLYQNCYIPTVRSQIL